MFREHKDNEGSTELATTLMVFSGKEHWHTRSDVVVEYAATDDTLDKIPIRARDQGGQSPSTCRERDRAPGRPAGCSMDCLDCHNRPAHALASTPAQVVDPAIVRGELSRRCRSCEVRWLTRCREEHPPVSDALTCHRRAFEQGVWHRDARGARAPCRWRYACTGQRVPADEDHLGHLLQPALSRRRRRLLPFYDDAHVAKGNPEKEDSSGLRSLCHKEE